MGSNSLAEEKSGNYKILIRCNNSFVIRRIDNVSVIDIFSTQVVHMSNVTECACKTKDILSDRCTVLHLPSSEYLSIIFGIILVIKVTFTKYGKVESMHLLRQIFIVLTKF